MFAPLDGFPPTLLTVGSGEVLRDDARTFARKLGEAQVAAELVEIADMEHTAPVRALHLPGAEAAMTATVRFVNAVAGC
jgi:acetyl esterase/lipase